MCDVQEFPKTFKEFIDEHKFKDRNEIYTNGSELISVYRVEQGIEHYMNENTVPDNDLVFRPLEIQPASFTAPKPSNEEIALRLVEAWGGHTNSFEIFVNNYLYALNTVEERCGKDESKDA